MQLDWCRQRWETKSRPPSRRRVAHECVGGVRHVKAGGGHVGRQSEGVALLDICAELATPIAGSRSADEVNVRGQVVQKPVALLDAILEVVAVADDVKRHVLLDERAVRAVDGDTAVVRAVHRAVAHVRTR